MSVNSENNKTENKERGKIRLSWRGQAIVSVIIAVIVLLSAFGPRLRGFFDNDGVKEGYPVTRNVFLLDTFCQLTIYDGGGEEAMASAVDRLNHYDDIFNKSKDTSDIYRINHRETDRVSIDTDTAEMLNIAREVCEETGGVLEPAIEPVSGLWDFKEDKKVPDKEVLNKALEKVKSLEWDIEGSEFAAYDDDVRIDIGAFAKGYIADRIKEDMLQNGVTSAIINLGGNVLCIGTMPDGRPFKIAIEAPGKQVREYDVVEIDDDSIVTAGIYERSFEEDGVLYHHILDPDTGYPVQNDLESVSVIGHESVICDALCTSIFIMGEAEGTEFIRAYNDKHGTEYEAVFLRKDGTTVYTEDDSKD